MDFVFLLRSEARARFLQSAARTLGCIYICLWSYLPPPSNCLISMDGWYHEDDTIHQPSSSSGSLSRRLFDTYRGAFCSVQSGCVPGLAYKERMPYVELVDSELMNLATTQVQRQFYQEAGIKKAVFMGCKSGEIELGMPAMSNINMQVIQQLKLYTEELIQQSQLGELLPPDHSLPSSPSSSLRSAGSPEYSSLLINKSATSFLPDNVESTQQQATRPVAALLPPHQMSTMPAYSHYHNVQFTSPASDDATITRAMLAVISSTSSPPPLLYHSPQQDQSLQSRTSRPTRSFKPYNSALAPNFESKPRLGTGGHKMVKMGISILRRIRLMRTEARSQESSRPASNQWHHVISERKRREKLNESFDALKILLPPGSKKDKASVLSHTRDYVNTLKAQITELEARNRRLEMQLPLADETKEAGDSSITERVQVEIIRPSAESTSETLQISLRIRVREECDVIDLILRVLECLQEMGFVSLVSVNASTDSLPQATLVLQVKASDWDEGSFKEAVTGAVDGVEAATANQP